MNTPICQSGYSLLELLIVLAIMSLLTALAIPTLTSTLDRLALSGDAKAVATGLRELRERALNRHVDIPLEINATGVSVLSNSSGDRIVLSWGTQVSVENPQTDNQSNNSVIMGWDGTMGGTIVLSRGRSAIRISVRPVTGRIQVENEK